MDYTLLNWRLELVPVGALPPTVLSDLCDDLESCFHREALGPDHPDYGESLSDLAIFHASTGDLEAAGPLFEESLAVRERAFGPHHPDVATSLNNLGVYHRSMGDNEGARPYYERALEAYEKSLDPGNPRLALPLSNLANLLKDLGTMRRPKSCIREPL